MGISIGRITERQTNDNGDDDDDDDNMVWYFMYTNAIYASVYYKDQTQLSTFISTTNHHINNLSTSSFDYMISNMDFVDFIFSFRCVFRTK